MRVLIVEGSAADAELEARELRQAGFDIDWRRVETLAEIAAALEQFGPELLLCGRRLPGLEDPEALRLLRERAPGLPILVVSASTDEASAVDYMREGAWDFIPKEKLSLLGPAVKRARERARLLAVQSEAQERLRMLEQVGENSPAVVLVTDAKRRIEYVNPAFTKITGYTAEEVQGRKPSFLKSGETAVAKYLEREESLQAGIPWRGEMVNRRKDGSLYAEEQVIFPVRDAAGHTQHLVEIALDISSRREAEASLRRSEESYRALVESMHDAVVAYDVERRLTFANTRFREWFGLGDRDLRDVQLEDLIAPEWRAPLRERHERRRKGEPVSARFECEGLRADGGRLWLEAAISPTFEKGSFAGARVVLRDLTERKRSDLRLRQLSRAVEQSPASIVITDAAGDIEYVNPAFAAVTGYSAEEVLGRNPRILKSGKNPPELYERLWDALTSGLTWQGELLNRKKSGELYWENAAISPLVDEAGRTSHYVAVKQEISDQKRAEAELARRNEELTRFNQLAVGRELRMIELKRQVNELARRLGEPAPYDLAFAEQTSELAVGDHTVGGGGGDDGFSPGNKPLVPGAGGK